MACMKAWQDVEDRHHLLFEQPRDMAFFLGIGLPLGFVSLTRQEQFIRVHIIQLSYARWLELWQNESTGSPKPISDVIAHCGNSLPSGSTSPGGGMQGGNGHGSSSSLRGGRYGGDPSRAEGRVGGASDSDSDNVAPSFLSNDENGVSKLHITVLVGNRCGEDIHGGHAMSLASDPEHKCSLSGEIEFIMSETQVRPHLEEQKRRKMEMNFNVSFHLPNRCVVAPDFSKGQSAATGDLVNSLHQRVGIMHDDLSVSFHSPSTPLASVLIMDEPVDVDVMEITKKDLQGKQKGWDFGVVVGGSSLGRGEVKHTRSNTISSESDVLVCSSVIRGTRFQLRNISRKSMDEHVIAFSAFHQPSLIDVKNLEEGGLHMTPNGHVTSDLARSIKLKCRGEFLLLGVGFKQHTLEMGRVLGELRFKINKGKAKKLLSRSPYSSTTLAHAEQKIKIDFTVNHNFQLEMYRNQNLYWVLVGMEHAPLPDVLGMEHAPLPDVLNILH